MGLVIKKEQQLSGHATDAEQEASFESNIFEKMTYKISINVFLLHFFYNIHFFYYFLQLHKILRPFLLRRLKVDVEQSLYHRKNFLGPEFLFTIFIFIIFYSYIKFYVRFSYDD